jgi:Flp pilus assembly pilin Flp
LQSRQQDAGRKPTTGRSKLYAVFGYTHARLAQAESRARQLVRAQGGQGTVEYVALVMLVALVMFGVVTAMKTYKFGQGQELGDLIVKKIKEAVSKVRY